MLDRQLRKMVMHQPLLNNFLHRQQDRQPAFMRLDGNFLGACRAHQNFGLAAGNPIPDCFASTLSWMCLVTALVIPLAFKSQRH